LNIALAFLQLLARIFTEARGFRPRDDVWFWPILLQKSEIVRHQFSRQKIEVSAIADKSVSKLLTEVTG